MVFTMSTRREMTTASKIYNENILNIAADHKTLDLLPPVLVIALALGSLLFGSLHLVALQ